MKKLSSLFLALLLCFSLTACFGQDDAVMTDDTTDTDTMMEATDTPEDATMDAMEADEPASESEDTSVSVEVE